MLPMVNELFRWYESAQLPVYDPGSAARAFVGPLPANAPGSVLCHVSVSKWCHGFNKKADSNELGERCARLTVDVSRKAIEILNAKIAQGKAYKGAFSVQAAVVQCAACHAAGKEPDIQKSKMDCAPCHSGNPHLGDKFRKHP